MGTGVKLRIGSMGGQGFGVEIMRRGLLFDLTLSHVVFVLRFLTPVGGLRLGRATGDDKSR